MLVDLKQMHAANLRAHWPLPELDDFADSAPFNWFLACIRGGKVRLNLNY